MRRPNALPRFVDSSCIFADTSVADRADILSGGRVSSIIIFLMFIRRSLITIWLTLKSPVRGNGRRLSPFGPPLRATGMIAPGLMLTACGLSTPSSAAVYTPAILMLAFFNNSSSVLFNVLMSGIAVTSGPRP